MPLVENVAVGPSPGPLPFSAIAASSRKEKKKQAKEERDRLKQAEKKKRRLEKALATAAAIRTELEKKKQRRKEEEQRLDEEGAALAEAVALQVLVDEDSDGVARFRMPRDSERKTPREEDDKNMIPIDQAGEQTGIPGHCLGVRRRENVQHNGLKRHGSFKFAVDVEGTQRSQQTKEMEWNATDWVAAEEGADGREDIGLEGELVEGEDGRTWEVYSTAEEKARASNERARAAEMAAGLAAAQAVAALRIAEEARAEAEAAKKAAEAAMNEALDRRDSQLKPDFLDESKAQPRSVEKERDELKARLEETERKLKEKTLRVSELEQNLEEVTQYFLEFKAMIEGSKGETFAICDSSKENGGGSERDSDSTPAESSGGTVDE
ncbi:hypothetical protein R1sor_010441 [Riccia sorocarpa]|uniref:Uncharacterized protein n=1 Tax=Riccia sorocarpa TaxID=122646 RepID=A0ABD3I1Y5_9MARC